MSNFDYVRPTTLPEAVALLNVPGIRSRVLAGGTDLALQLKRRAVPFDRLVDVTRVPELRQIVCESGNATILLGAAVTLSEILRHPTLSTIVPCLANACRAVGGVQIRNRATPGGNVANAAAHADLATVLLCLEAHAVIASANGERLIDIADLLTAGLMPGDLIRAFSFAPPPDPACTVFLRVASRRAMTTARASVAGLGALDTNGQIAAIRLAAGAVFSVPRRLTCVESMVAGHLPDRALFAAAGRRAAEWYAETSGQRWAAPYEAPVLAALTERALTSLFRETSL